MGVRSFSAKIASGILQRIAPVREKNRHELAYWRHRHEKEAGTLARGHFEYFYTAFFGLSRTDYAGKRVLDIGCGPRGSLEWISAEAECVGLDPLVDSYRALGIDRHRMKYVQAGAEKIPFPAGHFDVVASFNNLDHVDDLQQAITEIKRVTAPGGVFLLITEVEHPPTPTEPHFLPRTIARQFEPEFEVLSEGSCAMTHDLGIYDSLRAGRAAGPGDEVAAFALCRRKSGT
jgi:SAM-dependent methyltransferase